MLTQYKNKSDLLLLNRAGSTTRFDKSQLELMTPTPNEYQVIPEISKTKVELHIYAEDVWITGNHDTPFTDGIPPVFDATQNPIQYKAAPIGINLKKELQKLKITSGNFNFIVNFFEPLIGDYYQQYLYIDQISPDRTEIRLRSIDPASTKFKTQITNYSKSVNHTRSKVNGASAYHETYLLNFSRNKCFKFINSVVMGEYLYVKLQDPIPDEYDKNLKCWVVKETRNSYFDRVVLQTRDSIKTFNKLSGPNFFAKANETLSTETDFKTWSDLLGTSVQTSQQIVDSYFSGSLSGMKLGLDFSDFNNFVFYSSATERVKNFRFKLELLEYYAQQSSSISLISGSTAITNAADYNTQRTNLISGFDAFEKFLYYESSSRLTTYDNPLESANVSALTGSYITPVPKTNSTKPYTIPSVNSSTFITWYNGLIDSASLYDKLNNNSLVRAIPEFIRLDKSNEELDLFVNMLGHHYDILYMYINAMTKINSREENPKLGMPNDLLYSVAKQFGWNLTDGNQYQELWQYVYGTDQAGTPVTGSTSVNGSSLSGKDMTYTVWRRIVNNLPLLLKSKGTKRSIQALLSCYGIPQSMITIQEYGGPRSERVPVYEKLNFDYALDLINTNTGTVAVNYSQSLNTVELRFRTDNVVTNPGMPSTMNLFTVGNNAVTIDYTSGTLGKIQINGTASANIEMFDGGWLTAMVRTSGNALQVVAKRSKYGKIVSAVSASATSSFALSGSVVIGGTSSGASRLLGQVQELRLWSSSLNDSAFNNHVKAPAAYNGNIDAYDELFFRVPLTQKINHSTTSSLYGVQPVSSSISASFVNWSISEPYDSIEETYYYDAISLATATYDDNKVRIEDNSLTGQLSLTHRSEISEYDEAPLDTNKLGVFFSPQTMINDDIIAQLGFTSLDDYVGDPGDNSNYEYPALKEKAYDYWKKYTEKNDFNAYIKLFTMFDMSFFQQLEQLLPARVNKMTGILIQPNLLERNRYNNLPELSRTDNTYFLELDKSPETINASYYLVSGSISNVNKNITGSYYLLSSSLTNPIKSTLSSSVYIHYGSIAMIDELFLDGTGTVTSSKYIPKIPYTGSVNMLPTLSPNYISYTITYDPLIDPYSGSLYKRPYLIWDGDEYITGTTPWWQSDGVIMPVTQSVYSEFTFTSGSVSYSTSSGVSYGAGLYGFSTYATVTYDITGQLSSKQDFLPKGKENSIYAGSKITSPDFNINSTDTIDGGPVVEWSVVKGTQLIYSKPYKNGVFEFEEIDQFQLNSFQDNLNLDQNWNTRFD
jgi:hypothetical protein